MTTSITQFAVVLSLAAGCSQHTFVPENVSPASLRYVDNQSLILMSQLESEMARRKTLESKMTEMDSLIQRNNEIIASLQKDNAVLSFQFAKGISDKDNEISKLQMQIGNLNQLLGSYDGIMDSLLELNARQSKVYQKLYAIDQSTNDSTAQNFKDKQVFFLQSNLDSLKNSYSNLAIQQRNLYEDLTIVESSIMDIIQFSFNKAARQINDKNNLLAAQFNDLSKSQDSLKIILKNIDKKKDTSAARDMVKELDALKKQMNEIQVTLKEIKKQQSATVND